MPPNDTGSQWGQDLWLLSHIFPDKHDGFFVEAGAGNGRRISNTLKFAQRGWHGILIEPSRSFIDLRQNRPEAICLPFCLSDTDGKAVTFGEDTQYPNMSGIEEHILPGFKHRTRVTRTVTTVTLGTALRLCAAPARMDLLSLDLEGAEPEVLSVFPFDEFMFDIMLVELTRNRKSSNKLLARHGYERIHRIKNDDIYRHCDAVCARGPTK